MIIAVKLARRGRDYLMAFEIIVTKRLAGVRPPVLAPIRNDAEPLDKVLEARQSAHLAEVRVPESHRSYDVD